MQWPWWMKREWWRGFNEGVRAAFRASAEGADREQSMAAAALATYKQIRTDHPDLTWDQFLTTWSKSLDDLKRDRPSAPCQKGRGGVD